MAHGVREQAMDIVEEAQREDVLDDAESLAGSRPSGAVQPAGMPEVVLADDQREASPERVAGQRSPSTSSVAASVAVQSAGMPEVVPDDVHREASPGHWAGQQSPTPPSVAPSGAVQPAGVEEGSDDDEADWAEPMTETSVYMSEDARSATAAERDLIT